MKVLCLAIVLSSFLADQKTAEKAASPLVGERIVTIRWDAEFRVDERVTSKSAIGKLYTIDQVRGDWYWVESRGGWLHKKDVIPASGAVEHFTKRIREKGSSAHYNDRGLLFVELKDYDKAIADFSTAIKLGKEFAPAYANRAAAYEAKGERDKALADYTQGIELAPKNFAALNGRGLVHTQLKKYDQAMADFNRALELNPKYAQAYHNRAFLWRMQSQHAKALADYNQAIQHDPAFDVAYNGRAWLLATCSDDRLRDGKLAIANAQRACELTKWEAPEWMDTLAAAYAETGDFASAVKWGKQAVSKATDAQKPEFESRLKLYEARQPYREPAAARPG